jgi:tetratricopeptide (TPR) repeat protein
VRIKNKHIIIALCLVAIVLAAYWPALDCDFVNLDDGKYVTRNPYVQMGITSGSAKWAFTRHYAGNWHPLTANWHPLTWLSLMLDAQLSGDRINPKVFHATNVAQHAANTVLLFVLLAGMTRKTWPSAVVAALFAVHPTHVESVAWVTERKDTLSTLFWLLAMLAYWRYAECRVSRSRKRWYVITLVSLALGLMTKPMLVTLPFVLLLMDYWPLGRFVDDAGSQTKGRGRTRDQASNVEHPTWRWATLWKLVIEKLPMFALVVASVAVTFIVQANSGAVRTLEYIPLHSRFDNAIVAYAQYILKNIWPHPLAAFYPYRESLPFLQTAGTFVLLVTITAAAFIKARKAPHFLVGWLWYVGTLVPVIGLVQVGNQAFADRYNYVPTIGLYLAVVWSIAALPRSTRLKFPISSFRVAVSVLGIVAVAVLIPVTRNQVRHWQNSITLFTHALEVTKRNWLAHNNIAIALEEEGRHEEALEHYETALKIKPDYTDAAYNLGTVLATRGLYAQAAAYFEYVLELEPRYADAWTNYGNILLFQGRTDEAMARFDAALALNPMHAEAHNNLANALQQKGRRDEAIAHYRSALQIRPEYADAHNNLGAVLAEQGEHLEAEQHYLSAIRIDPTHLNARVNLGATLAKQGRVMEAVVQYTQVLAVDPNNWHARAGLEALQGGGQ